MFPGIFIHVCGQRLKQQWAARECGRLQAAKLPVCRIQDAAASSFVFFCVVVILEAHTNTAPGVHNVRALVSLFHKGSEDTKVHVCALFTKLAPLWFSLLCCMHVLIVVVLSGTDSVAVLLSALVA